MAYSRIGVGGPRPAYNTITAKAESGAATPIITTEYFEHLLATGDMGMQKGVAGKWVVFAYGLPDHANPGQPVTGDALNITANVRIDGAAANAIDDTNPTELEDGYYVFDLTAVETNGDMLLLAPQSSTANVQVIAVPGVVFTTPPNFNDLGISGAGVLTEVAALTGHTAQTGDSFSRLGAPAGASVSADIATVDLVADGIQTDLSNGTDGLGALAALINGLNDGDASAANQTTIISHLTDIKGATWDATNSLEAIHDDQAALNDLDAAGVRSAVGLATANLDTQLSTIDTVADGIQSDLSNATDGLGALKTLIDAIQTDLDNGTDGLGALKAAIDVIDGIVDAIVLDTGTDGVVLSAGQMNKIADHVIRRNIATARASSDGDTVAFRSLLGAASKLVNKVGVVSTNLITYTEDDSTTFGTQAITTDAAADPITSLDTV